MRNNKILWIDNTPHHVMEAAEILRDDGLAVEVVDSASLGAARIADDGGGYLAVIIDLLLPGETVIVPGQDGPEPLETLHGQHGGITLGRWLKRRWPTLNVIGVSIKSDPKDPQIRWFRETAEGYLDKLTLYQSPRALLFRIRGLRTAEEVARPILATYVVHGDGDEAGRGELLHYLTTTLRIPSPTVLLDEADRGAAILQQSGADANARLLVFVLLPPPESPARQAVLFEAGCLYAGCTRQRGKTLLLHRGDTAIAMGLPELVTVDVSHGIAAADPAIRRHVSHLLPLLRRR